MIAISGFASYLPKGRMSSQDIADASGLPEWVVSEKLGIHQKVMPCAEDQPTQMGVWAAEKALKRAAVPANMVDVVISVTEEHKEYPVWTSGIKLAYDLGAHQAYAYDLGQKCGTTVLALKQAHDLIKADETVNTVLIAGGYRNSDLIDFSNERVRFMYNLAAGGAALVVQREPQAGHAILGAAIITDGSFSTDVIVPVGGTLAPFNADNYANYKLEVTDPEGMKQRLDQRSLDNFIQVIHQAVEHSQAKTEDIAYVAMLHMKRSAHHYVLEALGLNEDQSIYLEDYGHLGQLDQVLSLELAERAGKIKKGDLVVLVAAGIGYVWNAICLRWGEDKHGL